MPYLRDRDYAIIRELIETIKYLAEQEGSKSVPNLSDRLLLIVDKYWTANQQDKNS
jgi:hypothetical protein